MSHEPAGMTNASPTALLLNVGHALDHLFLLIFATAVSAMAAEWGMIWQDLMPYTVGAFVLFGLGSLPAGRLGDLWGRRAMMVVFFLGMGLSGLAISGSLIFNFTTNGNGQLLAERLHGVVDDPATLGALLAVVYTVASFAQLIVGKLIDRVPLKWVYVPVAAGQVPLFLFASQVTGWPHYVAMLLFMVFVFGAIPFIDAMIVQYVDDRMRSRVAGIRLAVGFGVSSLAVYLLGPTVKAAGFTTLLTVLAILATCTTLFASLLPSYAPQSTAIPAPTPEPAL